MPENRTGTVVYSDPRLTRNAPLRKTVAKWETGKAEMSGPVRIAYWALRQEAKEKGRPKPPL